MDAVNRKIRKHSNMNLVFKDSKIIGGMTLTAERRPSSTAEVDYSDFCT